MTSPQKRDTRHDILFEPLAIGPKIARNRFYQVPHCNGMGHREPNALASMRGMKAQGGWAVVSTEEVEIHPSSEVSPSIEGRLWDDGDIAYHAHVVEAIQKHGALAAIELVYNAPRTNLFSRLSPMGVRAAPVASEWREPREARAMDKSDIADLRRWHRQAVRRAMQAGYDLIYVYAGHDLALLQQFLSPANNDRTDEYGGSLQNRMRLLREILEETQSEVAGRCGVPVRLALEEAQYADGLQRDEIEEIISELDGLTDLWDFCMGSWSADSRTARFSQEGFQEDYVRGLKRLSQKPVVGVGRFTSPDEMTRQIRSGVLDFIGAARPSIADPFLPNKIEEGRSNDLRECIGCNMCVAGDMQSVPLRCTQNPTMGEEWRRGWHPEKIAPGKHVAGAPQTRILIIGGGPAGLEAAHQLGKRGYEVALAEARKEMGGRVLTESRLPGLGSYARVAHYRLGQIEKLPNVSLFPGSVMDASAILEFGASDVILATGAKWRRNGQGREHASGFVPPDRSDALPILTPDDVLAMRDPRQILPGARDDPRPILIYDDDHAILGGAMAEYLRLAGYRVTLLTPAPLVAYWTQLTLEQPAIEQRLVQAGVTIHTRCQALHLDAEAVHFRQMPGGETLSVACRALLIVAGRQSDRLLYGDLQARSSTWSRHGLRAVHLIGDAQAPGMIAHAVYSGHLFAREFAPAPANARNPTNPPGSDNLFKREQWRKP